MVGPASAIEYYGAQNMFSDLEEVLPQDLFEQLKEEGVLFETTYTPTEEEMADGRRGANLLLRHTPGQRKLFPGKRNYAGRYGHRRYHFR